MSPEGVGNGASFRGLSQKYGIPKGIGKTQTLPRPVINETLEKRALRMHEQGSPRDWVYSGHSRDDAHEEKNFSRAH